MALSLRQSGPLIYDDQGPGLPHGYVGTSWFSGTILESSTVYYNNTYTETASLGDSFWFIFNGSKATVTCCGDTPTSIVNTSGAQNISLYVDSLPVGIQGTFITYDGHAGCLETPQLPYGTHIVNATVVDIGGHLYCIDYFEVVTGNSSSSSPGPTGPTSSSTWMGTSSSPGAPGPSTSHTRNVGRIVGGSVGGGVGGIILAALVIMCFLWGPGKECCKKKIQGNGQPVIPPLRGEYRRHDPSSNELGEHDSRSPHTDQGSNNRLISSVGQNVVDRPASSDFSEPGLTPGDVV